MIILRQFMKIIITLLKLQKIENSFIILYSQNGKNNFSSINILQIFFMNHRSKISSSQLPALQISGKDKTLKMSRIDTFNPTHIETKIQSESIQNHKLDSTHKQIGQARQIPTIRKSYLNQISNNKQNENQKHKLNRNSIQKISKKLEQLSLKVDNLIKQRLKKLGSLKIKNILQLRNKHFEDQYLKQIDEIVKQIHQIKYVSNNDQQIIRIGRKIQIMEKLLAQSSVQAQLIKKLHFSTIANKSNRVSEDAKNISKTAKNKQMLFYNSAKENNKCQLQRHQSQVTFQSINQQNYKKPLEQAYIKQSLSKQKYISKKIMTGSSTYNSDFPSYGSFIHYVQPKKKYLQNAITQKMNSSYQQTFKPLENKKIKYEDLDCKRDKMQNIKMSFMNICKKSELGKMINYGMGKNKFASQQMQKVENSLLNQTCLSYLSVPFKNNLSEHQAFSSNFSHSFMKDKFLETLKFQYKTALRN